MQVRKPYNFDDKYIPEPNSGCYIWLDHCLPFGHGRMRANGIKTLAHRYAYERAYGEIPKGMCVCHKCDVPQCVNPSHLFLGTHKDNMDDRDRKLRNKVKYGGDNHNSKFSNDDVLHIRSSKEKGVVLAIKYGVTPAAISSIKTRKNWAWLLDESNKRRKPEEQA